MFAFVSIVGLCRFALGDKTAFALFCLFGALTQFFDFYSYPLITCLFPLILLVDRSENPLSPRRSVAAPRTARSLSDNMVV